MKNVIIYTENQQTHYIHDSDIKVICINRDTITFELVLHFGYETSAHILNPIIDSVVAQLKQGHDYQLVMDRAKQLKMVR